MAEYIERIDAIKAVNKQNAFTMTRVALIDSLNSIPAAYVETRSTQLLSQLWCENEWR